MTTLFRRFRAPALCMLPLLLLLLAGCAQKEAENSTDAISPPASGEPSPGTSGQQPPPAPEGTMKVALITPGAVSDKGWNASAYEGLQKIKSELGAETSPPVEKPQLATVGGVLRDLAQQGHHVIFIHGSEFDDAAKQIAPDFPKTTFVVMGGRSSGPNLTPIQLQANEGTYLAGVLAAGMSKTGKLGLVGPVEIPIIKASFEAFEKGAKSLRADVPVTVTWTGDENDTAKGKQQAQALLDQGVDVIMHNANQAGLGVFQAVEGKPGAMVIGANADQSALATKQNLGSFILDVPNAMLSVAKIVQEGRGEGKPVPAGLKENAVYFKFNPGFAGTIPGDLKAKVEQAKADIIAGSVSP